jgi:CBS domain-containing protein
VPPQSAGLTEIARFLALRPPFDALSPEELGEVVAATEVEFFLSGTAILTEDGGPVTFLRVIHSGAVDIVHEAKLLDLLGPGDTFGHAAMLSGLPPGFEARAAQDTLCYRIPAAAARPLLERARSRELAVGVHDPGHQPVARLIRSSTVRCDPDASIGETARRMTEAGASAAIVDLPDGRVGIVTDRDLRTRVVAAGVPASAPVQNVMTTPVFTVTPDRLGGEVLFELLERGIKHAPVVSERGHLVGVVADADLFAVQPRSWFGVRRAIARSQAADALAAVARRLPQIVLDLHVSSLRALEVARVLTALVDAVTSRALDLAAETAGDLPDDGIVWVAVGSQARRELTPASISRGAVVVSDPAPARWLAAARANLQQCGLASDNDAPLVARTSAEWALASLGAGDELALEVLADRRALWGTPRDPLPAPRPEGDAREHLLARLLDRALIHSPPTGFDDVGVLELDGSRSDRLEIKRAAIIPIVQLACWAGAAAGQPEGSTLERLRVAGEAGVLTAADARTLGDSFELAHELRMDHHMAQLAAGMTPDDLLDPAAMSPLARGHLRDVFRAVTAVQRGLRR